ncbi:hypothetical protein [Streptomyces sp. NPDC058398]|uniref:hypothetical protein n=1 Tax=Streptomyces sp. NPDC058398 TaxID=3346479 RepID=UPI00365B956A
MAEGQGAAQQQESPGQPLGPEADAVELEFRPVVEDFTSALIARRGVSRAGRIQRRRAPEDVGRLRVILDSNATRV